MAQPEIDFFITKFKYLWHSGLDATLKVETNAGKAWVTLQVGLGQPPLPPYYPPPYRDYYPVHHRNGPARQRRRKRRDAARRAAGEEPHPAREASEILANNAQTVEVPAHTNRAEEVLFHNNENASVEEAEDNNDAVKANEINVTAIDKNFVCELCDNKFQSLKGLRTHEGKKHRASNSPIPQLDGATFYDEITWNFSSEYADDYVDFTIKEMFPYSDEIKVLSKTKVTEPRSAEHLFRVKIKLPPEHMFSWPVMTSTQLEVLKNLMMEPA